MLARINQVFYVHFGIEWIIQIFLSDFYTSRYEIQKMFQTYLYKKMESEFYSTLTYQRLPCR